MILDIIFVVIGISAVGFGFFRNYQKKKERAAGTRPPKEASKKKSSKPAATVKRTSAQAPASTPGAGVPRPRR